MTAFRTLIQEDRADYETLKTHLDALSPEDRVTAIRSISGKDQARLYERVAGATQLTLDHYVPDDVAPLTPVIHIGRNSLPMFTWFEKRFCRPARNPGEPVLWGYNEQTMRAVTGPGYFVVRSVPEERRVVIDYTAIPPEQPPTWPALRSNTSFPSNLVYGGMQDFMWKVSDHVSIGRAFRFGKATPNYFILCRQA